MKGDQLQAEEVLKGIENIEEWDFRDSDEENTIDIEVRAKDQADVREEIFYGMAEAQCPILMMRSTKVSLEDVFLELTADDKKVSDETHSDESNNESQSESEAAYEQQYDDAGAIDSKVEGGVLSSSLSGQYEEQNLDLQEEENEEKEEQVHDSDL